MSKKFVIKIAIIIVVITALLFAIYSAVGPKENSNEKDKIGKVEVAVKIDTIKPEETIETKEEVTEEVTKETVKEEVKTNPVEYNFDKEISKWNKLSELPGIEYSIQDTKFKKDLEKSKENIDVYVHNFNDSLSVSLEFDIDKTTNTILEARIFGYEQPDVDRASLFHFMSLFVSFTNGQLGVNEAGSYLSPTFSTNEEGKHLFNVNNEEYEFTLSFKDGLNMLTYKF